MRETLDEFAKKLCVEICKKIAKENNIKIEDDTFLGAISAMHEVIDKKAEEISMRIKENNLEKEVDSFSRLISAMDEIAKKTPGKIDERINQMIKEEILKQLKVIAELIENEEETKETALELKETADRLGMYNLQKRLNNLVK